MRPIDIFTSEEKNQFFDAVSYWQSDYGEATGYSQDRTDYIFRLWNMAKEEYLFKMFGNKLILSKDFHYTKSQHQLEDEIRMEVYDNYGTPVQEFIQEYREKVMWGHTHQDPEWQGVRDWQLQTLIDTYSLATNIYDETSFAIPDPQNEGKFIKITRGCKVSRMLGKIAKAFNLKHYEEFRIAHSMLLNNTNIKGKLVLSIHPNDYATMSDNDYHWDSCMSWWNNGGFAQGTVEMMNSPMVVVAYIEGDEPIEFGKGNWSNKKWRELFVVNQNVITEICPYPYVMQGVSHECLEWLRQLAVNNLGWTQFKDVETEVIDFTANEAGIGYTKNDERLVFESGYMYNDFRFQHEGFFVNLDDDNYWCYSGLSECLWCGETGCEFDDEGCLVGMCCDDSWTCANCGDRVTGDRFQVGDEYVCGYCYDTAVDTCECCNDNFIIDSLNTVYLGSDEDGWVDRNVNVRLCGNCFYDEVKCMCQTGNTKRMTLSWETVEYIDIADLTEYGVRKFTGRDISVEEFIKTYIPENKKDREDSWYL